MCFRRATGKPSQWTFDIAPIRELVLARTNGGNGWADPFCGRSTIAEYRNDLDPLSPADHHMDAEEWSRKVPPKRLRGVLFDPPYSPRQVSECYKGLGLHARKIDTSSNFYCRVQNQLALKMPVGATAISCGWDSTGFGYSRGFEIVDGLLVNYGGKHHDTIVTVEKRCFIPTPSTPGGGQ